MRRAAGGMTEWQIIVRHIVPNSLNVVIVYSSLRCWK